MALSAATVWEVRPAGSGASDNNGGGFVTGATGTDYSQQDAAAYSGTNLAIDATTNTKVTSATHNFGAADVGNLLQITAGSGFTAGFYQIVSVAGNAATLDRSAGTLGSTGGTFAVGGALASPGKAAGAKVAGNNVWIKAGTYSITSASTNVAGGCVSDSGGSGVTAVSRWEGYQTTRGDKGTKPLLQAAGAISSFVLVTVGSYAVVDNLAVDGASKTSSRGFNVGTSASSYIRCKASNCTNNGFFANSLNAFLHFCEATGCTSQPAFNFAADTRALYCYAHDNPGVDGFFLNASSAHVPAVGCISANNGGNGFKAVRHTLINCVAVGNGGDGFNWTAGNFNYMALNCIAYGNSAYGYNGGSASQLALLLACARGSNTSGATNGTITSDEAPVTLTADPFTNAAGGDYSLNTTAGGGALLRGTGQPGPFPGGMTGYPDIGALQSQGAGGGGATRRVWG
jgi:hypothetical protein